MDDAVVTHLLQAQSGVISRRQVLAAGGDDNDIERLIRRRVWQRVIDGVYVDHTGPLEWLQRAWVAVLHHWPAALVGQSALDAWGVRRHGGLRAADEVIHVGIDESRSVAKVEGIRVHRQRRLHEEVAWNLCPPRVRIESALLDVASRASDEAAAVAVLADGCQSRRTTAARLLEKVASRPRLPRRRLLKTILEDVAKGAFSVMERRYLVDVERRHGLPTATRQRVVRQGRRSPTATSTTSRGGCSSNSTGAWGMSGRRTAGVISTETSPVRSPIRSRSGWGGSRCSNPVVWLPPWRACCGRGVGPEPREPVGRRAPLPRLS